ncbi:unnamed protein product [Parajaminaea phylloscopi]
MSSANAAHASGVMELAHPNGQWDARPSDNTPAGAHSYRSDFTTAEPTYHSVASNYHADVGPAQGHYVSAVEEVPNHNYSSANSAVAAMPAAMYRPHSPLGATSSPNYKAGYGQTLDTSVNLAARNNSISSSVASGNDYSSSWSSTSPTMSQPGTRNNSIYSLDGHMGHVAINPQSDSSRFGQAISGTYVDRRFSLDERSRPLDGGTGSLLPARNPHGASTNGRHWPWGAGGTGGAGSSAQPAARASYDYGYNSFARPSQASGYNTAYDSLGALPDAAGRLRSMSSSAASGRHGVGGPLSAANGMAMSHYGSHLDLMGPIDAHAPGGMGIGGPQIGPGGGVTRRAKFKRSRTGCLICRKRKVKCSQDGTPCKQCRIGKRECFYEDNPPKRKRKGKTEAKDPSAHGLLKHHSSGLTGKSMSSTTPTDLYGQTTAPAPGVAFHMPFGSHDHAVAGAPAHYAAPASHEDVHTPTFGSAGWPVPPGAAHHRDSFSEQGPSYDGSLDSAASANTTAAYAHRPSFDASSAPGAVAALHDREAHAVAHHGHGPNGGPQGLGHVMHPSTSGHAQQGGEAMWYANGSHHDQGRIVYAGGPSTVHA